MAIMTAVRTVTKRSVEVMALVADVSDGFKASMTTSAMLPVGTAGRPAAGGTEVAGTAVGNLVMALGAVLLRQIAVEGSAVLVKERLPGVVKVAVVARNGRVAVSAVEVVACVADCLAGDEFGVLVIVAVFPCGSGRCFAAGGAEMAL